MKSLLFALIVMLQGAAPKASFEVASIRPAPVGTRPRQAVEPGGRYIATGVPLTFVINFAFRGQDLDASKAPAWASSDLWDIQAKAPDGAVPNTRTLSLTGPDPMAPFVQSLLEDRFQIKVHRETRDVAVYELTIAKGGLKIKRSEDQSTPVVSQPGAAPPPPGTAPRGGTVMGPGLVAGTSIAFPDLVVILSQVLQRKVIDKTDLKGRYDFRLEWTPDAFSNTGVGPFGRGGPLAPPPTQPTTETSGVSILTIVEDQLGLKVNAARAPVEFTVIDSVQKPSDN
jgi:uncharacterized protein (TIGR03435 family)